MKMRRKVILITLAVIVATMIAAALLLPWRDYTERFITGKLLDERKRPLLYEINHEVLATELRRFGHKMRWSRPVKHSEPESFDLSDPVVPPSLRIFKASAITIYDDRIEYDCGSASLDFGIVVFREGIPGSGAKELGNGIWFYSEDRTIPGQ